jgi:hypothetical protein
MPLIFSLLGLQALQQSNTITTIRPSWSELAICSLLTMLGLFFSAQFYMHTRVCSTLAAFTLIIILFVGMLNISIFKEKKILKKSRECFETYYLFIYFEIESPK